MAYAEPLAIEISFGLDRARVFLRGELDLATVPMLRERVGDLLLSNDHTTPTTQTRPTTTTITDPPVVGQAQHELPRTE
jgi:hypothetical protein